MNSNAALDYSLIDQLEDPKFFIETFFWIVDKTQKRVPFIFNPPQARYYAERTHHDLILKSRKEGFSSLIEALFLHSCIFKENTRAVVLSHELESTMRHFERIRYFLDNIGYGNFKFVVDLDKDSQRQLVFPQTHSSYWIGTAGSKSFGRGDDITHLHLSEVAHYQDQSVLTSVLEACVPNAYRVMETTANGVGEKFYKLWKQAKDPYSDSSWKPHFFSWYEDPTNRKEKPKDVNIVLTGREKHLQKAYSLDLEQILWYRQKESDQVDPALMVQEYPSNDTEAFLHSGRHVFNLKKIQEKKAFAKINQPLFKGELEDDGKNINPVSGNDGRLRVWKMPRPGRMYLISADVGEGVQDGNWSVAHILDRSSWEEVAVWRGRPDPGVFGEILTTLGYYYNNAVLVPELNNNGWATTERIKILEYPHLLKTIELWPNEPPKEGFPTNEKTRTWILTAIRNASDDDTVVINDMTTLEEMETFVQNEKTNKFEAQEGCFDDCVISLAIGIYCLKFLSVDETYASRAKLIHGSPIRIQDLTGSEKRKSATGYR